RHKFDGLLIRNLVYPMNRAIYSRRVREPYPPEFAFSGQLASHFLGQDFWSQDVGRSGAEIYLTISAIAENFRVAQSFLGTKSRVAHGGEVRVPAMCRSVGTLFWSLDQKVVVWSANSHSEAVPTFGPEHEVTPDPIRVNRARLHEMFVRGVAE